MEQLASVISACAHFYGRGTYYWFGVTLFLRSSSPIGRRMMKNFPPMSADLTPLMTPVCSLMCGFIWWRFFL